METSTLEPEKYQVFDADEIEDPSQVHLVAIGLHDIQQHEHIKQLEELEE